MPNHITNILRIEGDSEKVREVIEHLKTHRPDREVEDELTGEIEHHEADTVLLDFNNIVAMPESLNVVSGSDGDMGYAILTGKGMYGLPAEEVQRRFAEIPDDRKERVLKLGRIYKENKEKYGHTNWYDWCIENWGTKWNAYDVEMEDDQTFRFCTAWSSPVGLIRRFSERFPEVLVMLKFADEDTGSNVGQFAFRAGEAEYQNVPPSQSDEAYEICWDVRGAVDDDYYKDETGWHCREEDDDALWEDEDKGTPDYLTDPTNPYKQGFDNETKKEEES